MLLKVAIDELEDLNARKVQILQNILILNEPENYEFSGPPGSILIKPNFKYKENTDIICQKKKKTSL